MKKTLSLLLILLSATAIQCNKSSDDDLGPTGTGGGLSTNKSSMTVLLEGVSTAVISGGVEPYSISSISVPGIVSANMYNRQLVISAQSVGTTAVTVKDASSTPKTVTVSITVAKELTAAGSGTLSFNSTRGNFTATGIGRYGIEPPDSGVGALALQDFESIVLLAYNAKSASDVDIVIITLKSNTSNYTGTFSYPAAGKVVQCSYFPSVNPSDSLFLESGYGLTSSATATVSSVSAAAIQGIFSGNGYYWTNGQAVLSQPIEITDGSFHLPIIHFSAMEEAAIDDRVKRSINRLYRSRSVFR